MYVDEGFIFQCDSRVLAPPVTEVRLLAASCDLPAPVRAASNKVFRRTNSFSLFKQPSMISAIVSSFKGTFLVTHYGLVRTVSLL